MDFRQIDRDLQVEFATQKMNEEKVASQNLLRANSNPVYRKLDSLERELVFEISKKSPKTESFKNLKENLKTIREEKSKVLTKTTTAIPIIAISAKTDIKINFIILPITLLSKF